MRACSPVLICICMPCRKLCTKYTGLGIEVVYAVMYRVHDFVVPNKTLLFCICLSHLSKEFSLPFKLVAAGASIVHHLPLCTIAISSPSVDLCCCNRSKIFFTL
ncbi:hypothetical protein Csa_011864 [Cucumis sativus]|uniref:Uncharacterized protein n=1 Tax=Cucumis sativus TaxID=3659 RepID=A0A0A0K8D5_CUCSA|nr:hypothetical protein Csa_011864 [Cucumis sativus]